MDSVAVEVGVPTEAGARRLSEELVEERIAAGTTMKSSTVPGHYRWNGDVHERSYWTVTALTTRQQVERLYDFVGARHGDDLLPITYRAFEATPEYHDWIESNVGTR